MKNPVWLFDLDNTLHNASHAAFGGIERDPAHLPSHQSFDA